MGKTVPLSTLDFSMTITTTPKSVNIRGSFNEWLISMNSLAMNQKNILGGELEPCSFDPLTGWFRDGYCRQDDRDHGSHTVCSEVTHAFLEYTKGQGNDLSTPRRIPRPQTWRYVVSVCSALAAGNV